MALAVRRAAFLAALSVLLAAPAGAEGPIRIGIISSMSGPEGVLGREMVDGFNTAVREEGGKLGGVPVEILTADDQSKPDIGRQVADKMVQTDHVSFITGTIFSNVLLAIVRPVTSQGVFLLSASAGTSDLAGRNCNPDFFAIAFENATYEEAFGNYLNESGKTDIWYLAPNYSGAHDKAAGLKRTYKGQLKEVYTQFGQMDYAPQIAQLREAHPQGVFAFYPGGMGVSFVKQFGASGLGSLIQLYSEFSLFDETVRPAVGEAALGGIAVTGWDESFDNAANRRFVADFRAYWGRPATPYAAHSYDTARLLASALAATGGDVRNRDAVRAALAAAKFDSVRGHFRFNNNHYPIQDLWATEVVKTAQGTIGTKVLGKISADHKDSYAAQCPMKE